MLETLACLKTWFLEKLKKTTFLWEPQGCWWCSTCSGRSSASPPRPSHIIMVGDFSLAFVAGFCQGFNYLFYDLALAVSCYARVKWHEIDVWRRSICSDKYCCVYWFIHLLYIRKQVLLWQVLQPPFLLLPHLKKNMKMALVQKSLFGISPDIIRILGSHLIILKF